MMYQEGLKTRISPTGQETRSQEKETIRPSISSEMMDCLEKSVVRLASTVSLVADKTNAITRQEPESTTKSQVNPVDTLPPLWGRIRELTGEINRSIVAIEDNMRRLEL